MNIKFASSVDWLCNWPTEVWITTLFLALLDYSEVDDAAI